MGREGVEDTLVISVEPVELFLTHHLDDDGDVCLESNEVDNKDYTVQELIDILDRYRDSRYVYVYDDDYDLDFDIDDEDDDDDENYDHLWYIEDDCLYIDTYYSEDGGDNN